MLYRILTVCHLQDGVAASDVRQHVSHMGDVAVVQYTPPQVWPGLVGLINPCTIRARCSNEQH